MITYRPPVYKQSKKGNQVALQPEYAVSSLDDKTLEVIEAITRSGRIDFQASQMWFRSSFH